MIQIKAWALTGDPNSFRHGAAAYRNGKDWAKKMRDEAIEDANKAARNQVHDPDASFASAAPAGNSDATSQDTFTNQGTNGRPTPYDSDTLAVPTDNPLLGTRSTLLSGGTSSASRASQPDLTEQAAVDVFPPKRLATDTQTPGGGQ